MTKKRNQKHTSRQAAADRSRRRSAAGSAVEVPVGRLAPHGQEQGLDLQAEASRNGGPVPFSRDAEDVELMQIPAVHQGKGTLGVKFFFRDQQPAKPALLLIYNIPPGASEGVHTHNLGDTTTGSFDEFYYVLSGRGEMLIEGTRVPVGPGDHVFTPNGVAHGIENTSVDTDLRVYLVAMIRD
jgi:mannose-6-phosphate isomerase-like protein (cupin superfamily)